MAKRPVIAVLSDDVDDMQMLTPADLAAIAGPDAGTLAEKLSSGEIPGMFRVGSRLRILAKDFRAYVGQQQIGVRRMELEGYSPAWIAMQLPAKARKQYLESHKPGESWDPYAGARADADPAALRAYEARMQKLVAAGHLSEGEANTLKQLKANGIAIDGRPKAAPDKGQRRGLRSVYLRQLRNAQKRNSGLIQYGDDSQKETQVPDLRPSPKSPSPVRAGRRSRISRSQARGPELEPANAVPCERDSVRRPDLAGVELVEARRSHRSVRASRRQVPSYRVDARR